MPQAPRLVNNSEQLWWPRESLKSYQYIDFKMVHNLNMRQHITCVEVYEHHHSRELWSIVNYKPINT